MALADMNNIEEVTRRLREPFPYGALGFRPQSAKEDRCIGLAYIDARDVMDRLDDVVGPANWKDEMIPLENGNVMCHLSIRINDEWVTKTDVGGPSEQPDQGDRLKAAFSDAMKRAAVKWGIARYICQMDTIWCSYDPKSKTATPKKAFPSWALPGGSGRPPANEMRPASAPPSPDKEHPAPAAKADPPKSPPPASQATTPTTKTEAPPPKDLGKSDELFTSLLAATEGLKTDNEVSAWRGLVQAKRDSLSVAQMTKLAAARDKATARIAEANKAPADPVDTEGIPYEPS